MASKLISLLHLFWVLNMSNWLLKFSTKNLQTYFSSLEYHLSTWRHHPLSIRKHKPENSEPSLKILLTHSLTLKWTIPASVWYTDVALLDFGFVFLLLSSELLEDKINFISFFSWWLAEDLAYDGSLIKNLWNKGFNEIEDLLIYANLSSF